MLLLCAAAFGVGGCGSVGEVGSPDGSDRMLEDMSRQLERGTQLRYRADYQLVGGYRATVAQQVSPLRTAYGYPGGMLIVSEKDRTVCDLAARPPRCEIRTLSVTSSGPPVGYAEPVKKGLVTGPMVADLLRLAALQPATTVKPHDTTTAGFPASCLEVFGLSDAPAANFTVCVTLDGVLASFNGMISGVNADLALVKLELRQPTAAELSVPGGANVVDLRQT